jgi:tetratricopeptide (TPR) repeat protein
MTALQTGRRPNPIFECVWRMDRVVEDLHWVHSRLIGGDGRRREHAVAARAFFGFPADRFWRRLLRRPLEAEFQDLRRVLFDARTVAALASAQNGAVDAARRHLVAAAAVDPALAEADAVYLVARAEIEAQPRLRARLLRRASELAPKFQIAQVRLAQAVELDFRQEGLLSAGRVSNVMQVYDEVLRLNPGNLAAIAAQGYLHWMMSDLPAAEQRFRDGLAFKTIVRDTAAPELHYGLARVLAETGKDDEAYDQYAQAVAADRNVAAWTTGVDKGLSGGYYRYIESQLVARYQRYCDAVVGRQTDPRVPAVVRTTIDSLAWNDFANALLNDYFRNGQVEQLERARQALDSALQAGPTNSVAFFNLTALHEFKRNLGADSPITLAIDAIDRAVMLAPNWTTARDRQVELALDSWTLELIDEDIEKARGAERPEDQPWIRPARTAAPQAPGSQQLARRLDEMRKTYDKRLGRFFEDLTKESRLRELLVTADGDDDVGRWFDNALALTGDQQRIRLALFDRDDVQALSALVRFTTQRALNRLRPPASARPGDAAALPDAEKERIFGELRRARELLEFIVDRFLPADFDLRVASLKIADALGEPRPEAAQKAIGETVLFWTQEDPWHFWALEQWLSWLDLEQSKALAESLLRSRDCDPARLLKVGWQLHGLGKVADESELRDRRFGRLKELATLCVSRQPDLAGGHFLLAEALVDEGSAGDAMKEYVAATRLDPGDANAPAGMLALSLAQTQRAGRHEAAIAALTALAAGGDGGHHPETMRQLRRLAGYDLQRQSRLLVVTPIVIEAAADLVPLIATADQVDLQPALASETETLRDDLRRRWGVQVPGFRFRGNDGSLAAGTYIVMIDEVPLVLGRVEAGLQFWLPDDPAAATGLEFPADDPLTGRPGAWLPAQLPAALSNLPAVRFAPMTVVMRQLRALLERNLAVFFGHAELDALIADLEAPVRDALPADERTPLLLALRGLLADGVPIAALAAIVSAWPRLGATTPHRGAQAEALRRLPELAPTLPGNDGAHRLLRLGERFAGALRNSLVGAAEPVLAIDPALCQEMLAVVRAALPSDLRREPAALVVDDAALRPHLARLLRLEFPALPVLATDELGVAAAALPMASIDLEAAS